MPATNAIDLKWLRSKFIQLMKWSKRKILWENSFLELRSNSFTWNEIVFISDFEYDTLGNNNNLVSDK